MEWVETTGKSVDEAKELALDQLGVDENEAEFELIEEPKTGLFGRSRGTARVRARILPRSPRAKTERKRRPKKTERPASDEALTPSTARRTSEGGSSRGRNQRDSAKDSPIAPAPDQSEADQSDAGGANGGRGRSGSSQASGAQDRGPRTAERNKEPMDQAEQVTVLEEFLTGLAESFGLAVEASSAFDEDDLKVNLVGQDLGLLVGPRLATLDAIQEIARNNLQRQAAGREYARVTVDVGGIRERRSAALTEFVADAADQVRTNGTDVVFEVMSSADRKQVHDVAGELEGVVSASEGEDPRRRVVLRPA